MSNITTVTVSGVYNQWGITVYDYNMKDGVNTYSNIDFQDLLTDVSVLRAVAVEQEITPLSNKLELRNNQIMELSEFISKLAVVGTGYDEDSTATTEGAKVTWGTTALEGFKVLAIQNGGSWWYAESNTKLYISVDGTSYWVYTSGEDTFQKQNYEYLNQLSQSTVDNMNNDSQMDMNRLESLVSRRDESYTTATTLMTDVSDSRSTVINNM